MKKHLFRLFFTALFSVLIHADVAFAVEVAPRISDREIIERLTRLEEGQQSMGRQIEQRFQAMHKQTEQRFQAMQEQIEQRFQAMEQRMEAMHKQTEQRFQAMEQRMEAMHKQTGQRFQAMEQRFLSVEKRMDAQWSLTLALIMAIIGLVGFVVWDRKTALKPLERRFGRIADELERDLGVPSPEGSRLTRLIAALREIAPDDPKLSERMGETLRRHSLLEEEAPRRA